MRAPALNLLPPLRALVLSLSAMGLSAHAALFSDDEARRAILDLRERVQQLQNNLQNQLQTQLPKQLLEQEQRQSERLQEEGASLRRLILDLQAQIDLLRTGQSQLRGQNEQLQRDLALMQRATTAMALDLLERGSRKPARSVGPAVRDPHGGGRSSAPL